MQGYGMQEYVSLKNTQLIMCKRLKTFLCSKFYDVMSLYSGNYGNYCVP